MRRVAVVTGAARGIGAATVRALVTNGYDVVAVDSCEGHGAPPGVDYPLATRGDLDQLVEEIPDRIFGYVADVRDRAALDAVVRETIEHFGRIDAVVAGAAVIAGGVPLWESPESHLDSQWDVDVKGVWNTAAACVPHLLSGPDPSNARFVAIASAAGTYGLFHLAAYNTVKHAVVGLVKGLAADLVGTGVTACAVSPGSTRTPMLDASATLYNLASVDEFAMSQLLRRLITPEEIAETIVFCCSSAGAALNGSVVSADGGFGS